MAISIDASSPAVAYLSNSTTSTLVTASFTPPANTLLVACAGIGYEGSTTSTPFTISDSLSGTWQVDASEAPSSGGVPKAMVCSRWNSTNTAMTVTLNTDALKKGKQLSVFVLDGTASSSWTGGTAALTTTLDGSVTTTAVGSMVFAVAVYDTEPATFTADAHTTTFAHEVDTTDGLEMYSGYTTSATVTPGSLTVGWTGTHSTNSAWCAAEYLLPVGSSRPLQVITSASMMRASFY